MAGGYTIADTDRKHWFEYTFTAISEIVAIAFVLVGISRLSEAQYLIDTEGAVYYKEDTQKYLQKEEVSNLDSDSRDNKKDTLSYARSVALARSMLQRVGKIGQ